MEKPFFVKLDTTNETETRFKNTSELKIGIRTEQEFQLFYCWNKLCEKVSSISASHFSLFGFTSGSGKFLLYRSKNS